MKNYRLERYQSGGGLGSSLGKIAGAIGSAGSKVVSNPNFQKALGTVAETGLNVGSQIAINKLLQPNVDTQQLAREAVAQQVQPIVSQIKETYADRLQAIKNQLDSGNITASQARQLLDSAKVEFGRITGNGYRNVRRDAVRAYKRNDVMTGGMACPMGMDPASVACRERARGKYVSQTGGVLPFALPALGALAPIAGKIALGVGIPAVGGLVAGLLEKVAREKIPV